MPGGPCLDRRGLGGGQIADGGHGGSREAGPIHHYALVPFSDEELFEHSRLLEYLPCSLVSPLQPRRPPPPHADSIIPAAAAAAGGGSGDDAAGR